MKIIIFLTLSTCSVLCYAQENRVSVSLYDGCIMGGYVDNGAFLNFTGPNVNMSHKNSHFVLGMLPSLRFKKDQGTPKNAFITPTLGIGFTYIYKQWAVQVPLYYNAKTATDNGKWHIGIGIGLRFNDL